MSHLISMVGTALMFNALDMITGLVIAVKNKDIQSGKLRDGLFKKVGFMICYATAFLVDNAPESIGISVPFAILPLMCGYVVLTELVSILENICKLNPNILPDKLMEMFHITNHDNTGSRIKEV